MPFYLTFPDLRSRKCKFFDMKESQLLPYEHSEIKVRLLKLYLDRYIHILALARGVDDVHVYDLFCGEGIYDNQKIEL